MSADDAKALADDAPIAGPLIGCARAGATRSSTSAPRTSTAPTRTSSRSRCKNGDVEYVYLDPDHFLEIRIDRAAQACAARRVDQRDRLRRLRGGRRRVLPVLDRRPRARAATAASRRPRSSTPRPTSPIDDSVFAFPAGKAPLSRRRTMTLSTRTGSRRRDRRRRRLARRNAAAAGRRTAAPRFDAGVDLRPRRAQHRLGHDERPHRRGRRRARQGRQDDALRRRGVAAASGSRPTAARRSSRSSTSSRCSRSARSRSIRSNPKTIWVGTGESWTRNSVSIGDGIYKSTDGGETWTNMGLPESERIAKIIVDPNDGNTVYACVPGKLWSDSDDRGLYKTTDGGKTWTLVLQGREPLDRLLDRSRWIRRTRRRSIAGLWDFRRKGWTFRSGGERPDAPSGSGLFRSTDGGKTWTKSPTRRTRASRRSRGAASRSRSRRRIRTSSTRSSKSTRLGAVSLRRRRQDLGEARPEPAHGLASVLLREPHRRSEESGSHLQARPQPDRQSIDGGKSFAQHRRRRARRLSRRLDRSDRTRST